MGKKVLVAFDGSQSAMKAIEFALATIKEEDSMIILNVQKPQYDGLQKVGKVTKEELDQYYYAIGEEILNEAKKLIEKEKIDWITMVKIGLPSIEIAKVAKENNVHSIIMGSKGMSPSVNQALGGVTYSVIHLAPCPVTIVPFKEKS